MKIFIVWIIKHARILHLLSHFSCYINRRSTILYLTVSDTVHLPPYSHTNWLSINKKRKVINIVKLCSKSIFLNSLSRLTRTESILHTSWQTACSDFFFSPHLLHVIWMQFSYTYVRKGGQWVGWGCTVAQRRYQGSECGAAYVMTAVGGALKN